MVAANHRLQAWGEPRPMNQRAARSPDVRHPGSVSRVVIGVAAALALLYALRSILIPFFVALLLIALIDGQARGLKRFFPKAPDSALSAVAVALVIASLGACVIALVLGASGIVPEAPVLASRLDGMLADFSRAFGAAPLRLNDLVDQEALKSLVTPAVSSVSNVLAGDRKSVV